MLYQLSYVRSTIWGTVKFFSTEVVPFYISIRNKSQFQFFHMLINTLFSIYLTIAILMDIKWYLTVIFICILLTAKCLLTICIPLCRNIYLNHLPIFKWVVCLFILRYELFIYPNNKPLLDTDLPFKFLSNVLWCTKDFYFNEVKFIYFYVVVCASYVLRNHQLCKITNIDRYIFSWNFYSFSNDF